MSLVGTVLVDGKLRRMGQVSLVGLVGRVGVMNVRNGSGRSDGSGDCCSKGGIAEIVIV